MRASGIDKLNKLYKVYQQKNTTQGVVLRKKLKPNTISFLIADSQPQNTRVKIV